ncbi:acyltransferase family protein [Pannonibacter tanglangensis]|uniref:Acyltransferase family protein n=1 Tax=Pannonibacter tanglangensis TaxID=2750084 RepID=A0ABW9ZNG5_9HYPH|nr:acyltransferase family protein [Pannonibacter sp. XCT-34]NBN65638.1 acyltransferase family protein [Pannonibacter sp. XCT-34]
MTTDTPSDMRSARPPRIAWVDHAKGICIILVVMMHAVLGVEAAEGETGWMNPLVQFAAPFRMPDFFLISGLFVAQVLDRDWRLYLDRKVLHYLYFYLLWLAIQYAVKAPVFIAEQGAAATLAGFVVALVQPFGTLWFIYLLAIFFVVTRLLHDARVPWQLTLAVAALLQIAPVETGVHVVDYFCERFVYFFAGYVLAPRLFALADLAVRHVGLSLAGILLWAGLNGAAVLAALHEAPGLSLLLGLAGGGAIVLVSSLLAASGRAAALAWVGAHSIVIYLAFFFPMAASRVLLPKLGLFDTGTLSLLVTIAAVTGPVILFLLVERTGLGRFLFERPAWARLVP